MGRFDGKVVLVTGSSRNCGLEIADLFLREGAKVYTSGSTAGSTEKGAAELRRLGSLVETYAQLEETVRRALRQ